MPEAAGSAKAVVREFVARLNGGVAPWSMLSAAAIVTVNGTTPLSGRYAGKDLIRGILVDTARDVIATLHVDIDELIGTGTRVAALLCISGRSATAGELNAQGRPCGGVFQVSGGMIDEIIVFPDTSLIEMALYGRKFVPDA